MKRLRSEETSREARKRELASRASDMYLLDCVRAVLGLAPIGDTVYERGKRRGDQTKGARP